MAKYTRTGGQFCGTAAESAIQSGIVGIDRRNSITRWIAMSTAPP